MNFQMNGEGSVAEGFEIFFTGGSRGSTSSRNSSTTLRFDRSTQPEGRSKTIAVRLQRDDQDCQRGEELEGIPGSSRDDLDRRAKSTRAHLSKIATNE